MATAPAPPTLALAAGSDTGVSHTDGITNDTSPVITGTAPAGSLVSLTDADSMLALTTRADKNGNFLFTVAGLAAGAHVLTATATNGQGTVSAASDPLNLDIETDATGTSTPADAAPTATSLVFNVHFDQPVSTLSATSFVLATTGTAYGNVTSVTGSGEDYTVAVDGLGGDGTVALAPSADGPTDLAGNQVAFTSATHPVADTTALTSTLVSSDQFGVPGTGASPAISGGGRVVAFISDDAQLTPATQTVAGIGNVYVKDLQTGALVLVTNGNDQTYSVQISLDGTVVAFSSAATNLVSGGTPQGELNLYVARLTAANGTGGLAFVPGSIVRVATLDSDLADGVNLNTFALSGDGSTLAFGADSAVPGGTTSGNNSYLYDLATGAYTLIPGATSGEVASISRDGTEVAFTGEVPVPHTGGQPNPYTGGTYPPDVVQDGFVYNSVTQATTTIDGTGLLGTTAPTGPGQNPSFLVDDPQLSGDGKTVVFEMETADGQSSLFSVSLADPDTFVPVSPGASTPDGSGDYAYFPSLSTGAGVVAYSQGIDDPQAEIYTTSTHATATLGPAFQTVLSTQGNAVAVAESTDASGDAAVYEISLGVSASIAPIDGNDAIDAIDLQQAAANGLAVSGTSNAPAGSPVVLQVNPVNTDGYSEAITTAVGDDGQWTATLPEDLISPSTLPDGYYFLTVQVAGATGASAQVRRLFQVDTVAPAAPSAPVLDQGSNSGKDGIDTNVATPTLDGTAEPGATVLLYQASNTQTPLATATVDENGVYTLTSKPLADGTYSLFVEALDEAGNLSPASGAVTIKVDTVAPTTPTAPILGPGQDTGLLEDDLIGNPTPKLTGVTEANASVTLYDGGVAVGTGKAGSNGVYTITAAPLADGAHSLTVTATDAAGNTSQASDPYTLTIDTQAPSAPVIGSINGQTESDGTLAPAFDVTGSAPAGTTVTLEVDGVAVPADTAATGNSGAYDISVPFLDPGPHSINVIASDDAGNDSQPSAAMTVTITSNAGPPPPAGTPTVTGLGEDGPVAAATVFADLNGNGALDAGEPTATTDASGSYTLAAAPGDALGLQGGIDTVTGVAPAGTLLAPAGSTVIDPLTTFLVAYAAALGTDAQTALPSAVAALGLESGTNLRTLDPRAAALAGDATAAIASAKLVDSASVLSVALATAGASRAAGFAAVFAAFAQEAAASAAPISFDTYGDMSDVLSAAAAALGVTVPGAVADAAVNLASSGNTAVEGGTLAGIDAVETVEQAEAAPALANAGTDATALDTVEANFTEAEFGNQGLGRYIAAALPQVLSAPVLVPGVDGGFSDADNITAPNPTFTGTAPAYAAVELIDLTNPATALVVGSGTANADGHYTIQASLAYPDHTIAAAVMPAGQSATPGATATYINPTAIPVTSQTLVDIGGPNPATGTPQSIDIERAYYSGAPGAGLIALGTAVTDVTDQFHDEVRIDIYADGGSTPIGTTYSAGDYVIKLDPLADGAHTLVPVMTYADGETFTGTPLTITVAAPDTTDMTAFGVGPVDQAVVYTFSESAPGQFLQAGDAGSLLASTDASGDFSAPANGFVTVTGSPDGGDPGGAILVAGGLDTATGLPLPFEMLAPAGSTVVSPLTTILTADLGSAADAGDVAVFKAYVATALGLPVGTDVTTLDPLAQAEAGNTLPLIRAVEVIVDEELLSPFSSDVLPALASALLASPAQGAVDLTDPSVILKVLNDAPGSSPPLQDVFSEEAAIVAAANGAIEAEAASTTDAASIVSYALAVERLVEQTEAPALAVPIADGDTGDTLGDDFNALETADTGSELQDAIAATLAQTAQVTSFTADAPGTDASRTDFTLTFSQPVGGLTTGDFSVASTGGLAGAQVMSVTPVAGQDGTAWDVAVATGAGTGTVSLTFTGAGVTHPDGAPLATGQFGNPVLTASGTSDALLADAVAIGDFNGDGRPDVAAIGPGGLVVYLNQGGGSFQPGGEVYTGAGTLEGAFGGLAQADLIATGDFNGDGKLDVVTGAYGPYLSVLLGNGDGTFAPAREIGLGAAPDAIAVGDLNGDGKADLLVASGSGTLTTFLSNGDGTFTAGQTNDVGAPPTTSTTLFGTQTEGLVDLADLNGDGKLDAVVSTYDGTNTAIAVLLGNGDGSFTPGVTLQGDATETAQYLVFAVGDVNGDGIPDIVAVDAASPSGNVFLGKGDGTFAAPIPFSFAATNQDGSTLGLSSGQLITAAALGDLDGDGKLDLVLHEAGFDQVLIGNGDGTFRSAGFTNDAEPGLQSNPAGTAFALSDVNGDGLPDLITGAYVEGGTSGINGDNDQDSAEGGTGIAAYLDVPATVLPATASTAVSRAALAQPVLTSATGTLTQSAAGYTLDLGQVAQGTPLTPLLFMLANTAAAGSDSFDGTFSAPGGDGFAVSGASLPAPVTAGASYDGLTFTADTSTPGSYSETITFAPRDETDDPGASITSPADTVDSDDPAITLPPADTGGSDVSLELAPITLTVTDTVVPGTGQPPAALGFAAAPLTLPNVRVGAADTAALTVSNTAAAGAAGLDVTATASGDATASGSITDLAAGATDSTDLTAGLGTAMAGAQSGTVTLDPASDAAGVQTALPAQTVNVSGNVYRPAAAGTIAPVSAVVHVGDDATFALALSNTDPADGYSEDLLASATATPAGVTASAGSTPEIAPGASDSSLVLTADTSAAAVLSGNATVALTSDGGTGAGSIDGLGQVSLGTQDVPVSITVDNYAAAQITQTGGAGTLTAGPDGLVLDFGTVAQGSAALTADLAVLNSASGPADLLSGSLGESGDDNDPITAAGLAAFTDLAAGQADDAPTVSLSTATAGSFSATLTLSPTGSNASGYSGELPTQTLIIRGTVTPATTPPPAAPVTTPASLTVAADAPATAIGIPTPTDPAYDAAQLSATVTALPDDGTVALADGGAAVTLGQVLSATQLAGLTFLPTPGDAGQSSSFGYTVSDPAGASAAGIATLTVTAASTGTLAAPVITTPNEIVDTPTPTIRGTAASGSTVTLFDAAGDALGSTVAAADGSFAATVASALPLGASSLTAVATEGAEHSAASNALGLFTVEAPGTDGIVRSDFNSLQIGTVLGQGYALSFLPQTEALVTVDGTLSVQDDTEDAFVTRLYQGLLGRAPDAAGASFWHNLLYSGYSHAALASAFMTTAEYQADHPASSDQDFVTSLYQGLLGRAPDATGAAYYTAQLASGISRGAVAAFIADSAEAKAHLADATPASWVASPFGTMVYEAYQTGLDQEVTRPTLQAALQALRGGESPADFFTQLANSPAFLALHASQSNADYVSSLYQAGLGRTPDAGGAAFYDNLLASGIGTRASVLQEIATSTEATAHLTRTLAQAS